MLGWIDGDRLVSKTIDDLPVRLRLVWARSDPANLTWRNEMPVGGAPWVTPVEAYHCSPAERGRVGHMCIQSSAGW
jgi:hypothetical protein